MADMTLGIERRVTAFEFKVSDSGPAGSFEGYGSVFNNEDGNGDMMLPGSFTKTLADYQAKSKMPKMLLNHGGLAGWGSPSPEDLLPIGKWTALSEDTHGLQCKGQLIALDTETGKRVHAAMKEGQLDGLSIGYRAKDFVRGSAANEPRRTIKAVDLIEISPVTFPANASALVTSVKSAGIRTIRDFEEFLRDAGGFSHAAAKAIAASGFKASPEPRDEDGNDKLAGLIERLSSSIHPKR
jgi:HK97 family phage prohead protease